MGYVNLPDGQNLDYIKATGLYRYGRSGGQVITGTGLDLSGENETAKRNLLIACFGDGSTYCIQVIVPYSSPNLYIRMWWSNTATWTNIKK